MGKESLNKCYVEVKSLGYVPRTQRLSYFNKRPRSSHCALLRYENGVVIQ